MKPIVKYDGRKIVLFPQWLRFPILVRLHLHIEPVPRITPCPSDLFYYVTVTDVQTSVLCDRDPNYALIT